MKQTIKLWMLTSCRACSRSTKQASLLCTRSIAAFAAGLVLGGAAMLTSCSERDNSTDNTPDPVAYTLEWDVLKNVSGVSDVSAFTDKDGKRTVAFWFTQPVDHSNPSAGTFKQKCVLHYEHADSTVVLHTQGYAMAEDSLQRQVDISRLLGANFLEVEHRFYGYSQIEPLNWDYNTAAQSTADLHAIVTALKGTKAFHGKWLSTGTSKNGILTALYAYYYPNEVDVYVPFCAPFITGLEDLGVGTYLAYTSGAATGDSQRIISALQALIRDADRRAEVVALCRQDDSTQQFAQSSDDDVFTRFIFDFYENLFDKFAYHPIDAWRNVIPSENSSAEHIYRFYKLGGKDFDKELGELQESLHVATRAASALTKEQQGDIYYIQAAKELGHYLYDYSAVVGDGLMPASAIDTWNSWYTVTRYSKKYNLTYDGGKLMNGFLDFVKNNRNNQRCRMLFVYGANDPWTGAAIPDPEPQDPYVKKYVVPNGVHSHYLEDRTHYSAADANYIMTTIRTWLREN